MAVVSRKSVKTTSGLISHRATLKSLATTTALTVLGVALIGASPANANDTGLPTGTKLSCGPRQF